MGDWRCSLSDSVPSLSSVLAIGQALRTQSWPPAGHSVPSPHPVPGLWPALSAQSYIFSLKLASDPVLCGTACGLGWEGPQAAGPELL